VPLVKRSQRKGQKMRLKEVEDLENTEEMSVE
jgi:hypothetical protein